MEQIFSPQELAVFFWLTFFGWAIIELRSGSKHQLSSKTEAGRRNDIFTLVVPALGVVLALVLRITLPNIKIYDNPLFFWLGLSLAWGGIVLRLLAIKTLGKFFVMTIITQNNQPVISSGPYRLIRHPSYLGGSLSVAGVALALNGFPGAILMMLTAFLVIVRRIELEEAYLLKNLGKPYKDYTEHTKKLLPFVW